jgi:hypothetical protein
VRRCAGRSSPSSPRAGTVIAGLLCLLLSALRSNSALGPVAALGILSAMLAALTLLPAALLLCGRVAFWPRRPLPHDDAGTVPQGEADEEAVLAAHGAWGRVAAAVRRRPRPLWILTALVLGAACLGLPQLEASGVAQSDLVLGESSARDGQVALGEHFPAGAGSPVQVITDEDDLEAAAAVLLAEDGIDEVTVTAEDAPSGSAPVTEDGVQAAGPPGTPAPEPTVVVGQVLLQGTLADAPDSAAAEQTVRSLRAELAADGPEALVGGSPRPRSTRTTPPCNGPESHHPGGAGGDPGDPHGPAAGRARPRAADRDDGALLRCGARDLRPRLRPRARLPRRGSRGAAVRLRVPGGARDRLQHLPHDAGAGGGAAPRHRRGRDPGAGRDRRG